MRLFIVMKRNEMLTAASFLVTMSNSIRFCQCDEEKIYFTIDLISPRAFQEEFSVDFHRSGTTRNSWSNSTLLSRR